MVKGFRERLILMEQLFSMGSRGLTHQVILELVGIGGGGLALCVNKCLYMKINRRHPCDAACFVDLIFYGCHLPIFIWLLWAYYVVTCAPRYRAGVRCPAPVGHSTHYRLEPVAPGQQLEHCLPTRIRRLLQSRGSRSIVGSYLHPGLYHPTCILHRHRHRYWYRHRITAASRYRAGVRCAAPVGHSVHYRLEPVAPGQQ